MIPKAIIFEKKLDSSHFIGMISQTKVYYALKSLEKHEQTRFAKFLRSPYYNRSEQMMQLHDIMLKALAQAKEMAKEAVWKKLGFTDAYDDVRFRKLCSDLLSLFEEFLALQKYESVPIQQAIHLIDAVVERKIDKLYNTTIASARRLSAQYDKRDARFYLLQYQIENNYYYLADFENKREAKTNVESIAGNLDFFYLAEKLRLYSMMLSQQAVTTHQYELLLIQEIIGLLERHTELRSKIDEVPPVAIYYQIFLLSTERDKEEHYFKFKELLTKYGSQFSREEAAKIYTFATNYCISKVNLNLSRFLRELHELNIDMLERELLFNNDGELSPFRFRNIVTSALRLGEMAWTEQFIHKMKPRLPENSRDNALSFNLSSLYFYQKKFEKVIRTLATIEYEDILYNLNAKTMLLASYYELDETEALFSFLESFRTFINRHKDIPANRRGAFISLIKFTKKLITLSPRDKKGFQKLKEEVVANKDVPSKAWLLEKIAQYY